MEEKAEKTDVAEKKQKPEKQKRDGFAKRLIMKVVLRILTILVLLGATSRSRGTDLVQDALF